MTSDTATRDDLYRAARAVGLDVGARATKQELLDALRRGVPDGHGQQGGQDGADRQDDGDDDGDGEDADATDQGGRVSAEGHDEHGAEGDADDRVASRVDAFRRIAEARAAGEMVLLPRTLTGDDRRVHVRQTIREDHQLRIARHDEEVVGKFDKLAGSRFSFFRGTALLFYRDMVGEDPWMPTVLVAGDIHPENFGVVPSADNVPTFGINDYDEVFYAPFTWDLKRGGTGFVIAADEIGGLKRKQRLEVVRSFVRGYIEHMRGYQEHQNEKAGDLQRHNAPKLIADLIDSATEDGRARWLEKKYFDEHKRGFRASRKLTPVSSRKAEFQRLIDEYVEHRGLDVPDRVDGMRVKDVAERHGQGTASLGLTRYYVMLEGASHDATDDVLLELKQARRSALEGVVPPSPYDVEGAADRVAYGQRVQTVSGDVFYGSLKHEGVSYLVRERSSFRDDIDLDDLDFDDWCEYARICGGVVAHAHALSDDLGVVDVDIEPEVLEAMGREELFVDDLVRFCHEAAERNRRDHEAYRADHALGAFEKVDRVYR
ncbi:DUF2252 domain-containing protein [Amnibacterium endophyticum]|uniref:DUF2252 domain-containing protein n=1 Tax=Amnibacterium endophyticum TaxID=2109337 RepID=A0ABW4LGS6_9MICO